MGRGLQSMTATPMKIAGCVLVSPSGEGSTIANLPESPKLPGRYREHE